MENNTERIQKAINKVKDLCYEHDTKLSQKEISALVKMQLLSDKMADTDEAIRTNLDCTRIFNKPDATTKRLDQELETLKSQRSQLKQQYKDTQIDFLKMYANNAHSPTFNIALHNQFDVDWTLKNELNNNDIDNSVNTNGQEEVKVYRKQSSNGEELSKELESMGIKNMFAMVTVDALKKWGLPSGSEYSSSEEAEQYIQATGLDSTKDIMGINTSMWSVYSGLADILYNQEQTSYSKGFPLNEVTAKAQIQAALADMCEVKDNRWFQNSVNKLKKILNTNKLPEISSDQTIDVLRKVHDRWIKHNEYRKDEKIAAGKGYQYNPLEEIGWEETKKDLIFVKPFLVLFNNKSLEEQLPDIKNAYDSAVAKYNARLDRIAEVAESASVNKPSLAKKVTASIKNLFNTRTGPETQEGTDTSGLR